MTRTTKSSRLVRTALIALTIHVLFAGATPGAPSAAGRTLLEDLIFADGFESGNTCMWSSTVPAGPFLSFTAESYKVNEEAGSALITVRRTGICTGAVSVECQTADGTATAGSDYTATTEVLIWADGDAATKTCTVPILDDASIEADETVNLSLINPTGGAIVDTPSTATLTIHDAPGALSFSVSNYDVTEGAGTALIAVRRTGGSAGAVSVDCETADGSATAGDDYTATTETLNWADGETANKICTVPIVADAEIEGTETVNLSLTNPTGGASLGPLSTAILTIHDSAGEVSFTLTDYEVNEGDGTASIAVRRTGASGGAVSVQCETADGSATAGSDYTATTETLNWADGETADKTCTVPIVADAEIEGTETVSLALTNPTGGASVGTPATATLRIHDAPGQLSFTVASYEVNESNVTASTASVAVRRTAGSGGAVSVRCDTVAGGTATAGSDYTTTTDTLSWADGETANKICTVPILPDGSIEADETVNLALTNPTGGASLGTPGTATLTIHDSPGKLRFTVSSYQVNETVGTASVAVRRVSGSGGQVGVRCDTADGSATAGSDYTATTDTLTWADGDTANKLCTIPIIDDLTEEANETISLELTNFTGGAAPASPLSATLTILDDDAPSLLSFSTSGYEVHESAGTAVITVQRTGGFKGAVSVRCDTAGGSATADSDYTPTMDTLTWSDGETTNKTCIVPILVDGYEEGDETVTLSLTNPAGMAGLVTLDSPATAILTILDADGPGELSFVTTSPQVDEDGVTVSLAVQRTGGSAGAVSVRCATVAGGTATAGSDYATTTETLHWAAGDTEPKTCRVPISDDGEVEGGETVMLALTNAMGTTVGNRSTATPTIVDDDASGELSFAMESYEVSESAGTASLAVQRTGGSAGAVSVSCATVAGGGATAGSDYTATTQTLDWAHRDTARKTCSVPIADDGAVENAETVMLALTNANGATLGSPRTATLTLVDDDNPAGNLGFTRARVEVHESIGTASIVVRRTGGSTGMVSVRCDTVAGGSAAAGSDYTPTTDTLHWADGDTTDKTCTVPITDDAEEEGDETINLALTHFTGGAGRGTRVVAVLTIFANRPGDRSVTTSSRSVRHVRDRSSGDRQGKLKH